MMKHRWKGLLLAGAISLSMLLTGCYIPPDDVTGNSSSITVGSNNLPFATLVPTATVTPTGTPEAVSITPSPTIAPNFFNPVSICSVPLWTTTSFLSLLTFEVMEPAPMCE